MRYFFENLTYYFIPQSGCKYSHTNSYNSTMTVIAHDDHLTAGAGLPVITQNIHWLTSAVLTGV